MVTAMAPRAGLILLGIGVSLAAACGGQPPYLSLSQDRHAAHRRASRLDGHGDAQLRLARSDHRLHGIHLAQRQRRLLHRPDRRPLRHLRTRLVSPPRPADCEFDYGQGISLSPGENATFVCAGDTALGGGQPLAYGKSISAGVLVCDSAESGITCRDTRTGHGFAIAREAYRVF